MPLVNNVRTPDVFELTEKSNKMKYLIQRIVFK